MSTFVISQSNSLFDDEWDEFLEHCEFGHFQQSTSWARYKGSQGWSVLRVLVKSDGSLLGGFQILWKKSRIGLVGYLSRGPVWVPLSSLTRRRMMDEVESASRELGLYVLIHQYAGQRSVLSEKTPFDTSSISAPFLGVVDCTFHLKLSGDISVLESGYRSSTRKNRNKARRAGMVGSWGTRSDLAEFYRLMCFTCKRQGVQPNPTSLSELEALWDSFAAKEQRIRLRKTEFEGELVCVQLFLVFGGTITLLKVGWSGMFDKYRPNAFQICEVLEWACLNGYAIVDFAAFDKELAAAIISGESISSELRSRRDFFKTNFGGHPFLQPICGLWIPSRFLRYALMFLLKSPLIVKYLKRRVAQK